MTLGDRFDKRAEERVANLRENGDVEVLSWTNNMDLVVVTVDLPESQAGRRRVVDALLESGWHIQREEDSIHTIKAFVHTGITEVGDTDWCL